MKVRCSFDGSSKTETWNVDSMEEISEPNLILSRHSRELAVTFETHSERERFWNGVFYCRAFFFENDLKYEIYLHRFGMIN